MGFTCRQCGSCCMYLGDYIVIERQTGPFEFACESVSTGTPFTAEVDEDKRTIFSDRSFPDQHPSACRFLRPDGDLLRCTIHRDSPAQCKFYRCVVMRVSDSHGTSPRDGDGERSISIPTSRGSGLSGKKLCGNGQKMMLMPSRGSLRSCRKEGTGSIDRYLNRKIIGLNCRE